MVALISPLGRVMSSRVFDALRIAVLSLRTVSRYTKMESSRD